MCRSSPWQQQQMRPQALQPQRLVRAAAEESSSTSTTRAANICERSCSSWLQKPRSKCVVSCLLRAAAPDARTTASRERTQQPRAEEKEAWCRGAALGRSKQARNSARRSVSDAQALTHTPATRAQACVHTEVVRYSARSAAAAGARCSAQRAWRRAVSEPAWARGSGAGLGAGAARVRPGLRAPRTPRVTRRAPR